MNLTPFIITKMAHDIAGCAGAVLNTSELLTLDADSVTEVLPLLNESAQTLVVRLKFFRCLFGSATTIPPDIAQKYLQTLSMPFQLKGRFETPIELGFVLAATDFLPKGGVIERTKEGVNMKGTILKVEPIVDAILHGVETEITPHTAVLFWLKEQLAQHKQKISITVLPDRISFIIQ